MKSKLMSAVSFALVVLILIPFISIGGVSPKAYGLVKSKLDAFISKYPNGSRWTSSFDGGSQCYGFAKLAIYNVFGASNSNGYTYRTWRYDGTPTSGMEVIGSITSYSYSNVKSLLSNAKCGDVLQFNTTNQHTMIVYGVDSDGVWVYDCNSDRNCGISLRKSTFGAWNGRNSSKLTLLRSTNYSDVDGYGPHECDKGAFEFYEAAHPHYNCYKCSICGEINRALDETNYISSCQECTPKKYAVTVWASDKGSGYQHNECPEKKTGSVGNSYYIWYKIYDINTGNLYSENTNFTATISIYNPDNTLLYSYTYANSSSNWIKVTPTKVGSYRMNISLSGDIEVDFDRYFNVSCDGVVEFDKSAIELIIPENTTEKLTISLSDKWPDNTGYIFEYDDEIVSFTQNVRELTITAKKEGITDFSIVIVDKGNNNQKITSATCRITVKKANYIIKYNANGGTGAPANQTKYYNTDLILSSIKPVRNGYTFLGWSTDSSATTATYLSGGKFNLNEATTLYAVWKPNTYTIAYNANGGIGAMVSSSHNYDESKKLSQNAFSREGYVFVGWSTDPNAEHPTYSNEDSVKNLSSENYGTVNLYAVWKSWFYGDLNSDGKISIVDITMLMNYSTNYDAPNLWQKFIGDVNGDGVLNDDDNKLLSEYNVGLINHFPADKMRKSLEIESYPYKTNYYVNEKLMNDGLCVVMVYPDTGAKYDLTEYCQVSAPSLVTAGTKYVNITFKNYSVQYKITVNEKDEPKPSESATASVIVTEPTESQTDSVVVTKPEEITTTAPATVTEPEEVTTTAPATVTEPEEVTTTAPATVTDSEEITTTAPVTVTEPEEVTTTVPETVTDPEEITTTAPATVTEPEEVTTTAPATVTDPEEITTTAPATVTEPEEITTTAPATVTEPEEVTTTAPATVTEPEEVTTTAPATVTDPKEITTTAPATVTEPEEVTTTASVTVTEPQDNVTDSESTTETNTTVSEEIGVLGDVNNDGKVNIKDVTHIQKYAAKIIELSELEFILADINSDLKVNIKDATLTQKYAAKIETGYPIGEKAIR